MNEKTPTFYKKVLEEHYLELYADFIESIQNQEQLEALKRGLSVEQIQFLDGLVVEFAEKDDEVSDDGFELENPGAKTPEVPGSQLKMILEFHQHHRDVFYIWKAMKAKPYCAEYGFVKQFLKQKPAFVIDFVKVVLHHIDSEACDIKRNDVLKLVAKLKEKNPELSASIQMLINLGVDFVQREIPAEKQVEELKDIIFDLNEVVFGRRKFAQSTVWVEQQGSQVPEMKHSVMHRYPAISQWFGLIYQQREYVVPLWEDRVGVAPGNEMKYGFDFHKAVQIKAQQDEIIQALDGIHQYFSILEKKSSYAYLVEQNNISLDSIKGIEKLKYNRSLKYYNVAKAAKQCAEDISKLTVNHYEGQSLEDVLKNFDQFKVACFDVLSKQDEQIAKQLKPWKAILKNVLLALCGLIVFYVAAGIYRAVKNKNASAFFVYPKTDLQKRVDHFKNLLVKVEDVQLKVKDDVRVFCPSDSEEMAKLSQ